MSAPSYKFLPFLRRGASSRIETPDAAQTPAWATLGVKINLSGEDPIEVPVNLYGPGDVVGLEPSQISRRLPLGGATGFAPNGFALVEFAAPDLPWRFSPFSAGPMDQLRPWLALVALRAPTGFEPSSLPDAPLPVIAAPRAELPDLSESHAWAHVQVTGPFEEGPPNLGAYIRQFPERCVARLLCARRLEPNTRYLLCLVPTFQAGLHAGLGHPHQADDTLEPAWTPGDEGTVLLPLYDSWQFETGANGDFESVARRLKPRALPEGVGELPVQIDADLVAHPPGADPPTIPFQGVFRPVGSGDWVDPVRKTVAINLAEMLNHAAQVEDQGGEPQVSPPLYGRAAAGVRRVPPSGGDLPWLRELNVDPRFRIAAGVGAAIVRNSQEEFVRDAWEQVGEISQANNLLKGAQLARVLHQRLVTRHLSNMAAGRLLQTIGPVQDRLPRNDARLYHGIVSSRVPSSGGDGAFRRLTSSSAAHSRRFSKRPATQSHLFRRRFDHPDALEGWQIVDQGKYIKPSSWNIYQGTLRQTKDTYSPPTSASDPAKLGTFALYTGLRWMDQRLTVVLQSLDDDAIGVMFRYRNAYNYYRFSMDQQRNYRRLVKCTNGQFTVLWQQAGGHTLGAVHEVEIISSGDRIRGYLDNALQFDLLDTSHLHGGGIGLYCWGNKDARFLEVECRAAPRRAPVIGSKLLYADLQFSSDDIFPSWDIYNDMGTTGGPSKWSRSEGTLTQTSAIGSTPNTRQALAKRGAHAYAGLTMWTDVHLSARLRSPSLGSIGLLFRVRDNTHYYRFALNGQHNYCRLLRRDGNDAEALWEADLTVEVGRPYRVDIIAIGSRLVVYLDGRFMCAVHDRAHQNGRIGLYSYFNPGANFSDLSVRTTQPGDVLERIDDGEFSPAPAKPLASGLNSLTRTIDHLVDRGMVSQQSAAGLSMMDTTQTAGFPVHVGPKHPTFRLVTPESVGTPPTGGPGDSPDAAAFRPLLAYHQDAIRLPHSLQNPPDALGLAATKVDVLDALDSTTAVSTRARRRMVVAEQWVPRDPVDTLLTTPQLNTPLCHRLDPWYLLPGSEKVPPDSVTMLETNNAFVRALMVGANHEMARELLWRGFPSDPRGTSLRRFWDIRGRSTGAEIAGDIAPIRAWQNSQHLGDPLTGQSQLQTVFMIRGELIRRFPDAVFYCAQAVLPQGADTRIPGPVVKLPLFRGHLADDLAYFGFAPSPAELVADEGWFFVVEQRPGTTCFGLDVSEGDPPAMATWQDLTWGHVHGANYLSLEPPSALPADPGAKQWGRNAAHMAAITLQRPMTIAIHIRELLATPEAE